MAEISPASQSQNLNQEIPGTNPTSTSTELFEHESAQSMLDRMRKRLEEQTRELCILAFKISSMSPDSEYNTERHKLEAQHVNLMKAKEMLSQSIRVLLNDTEVPSIPSSLSQPTVTSTAIVRSSNKPSRLPAGLPTFNSDTHKENPVHFLKKLELRLETDTYPRKLWPKALAGQITGSGASWALRTLIKEDIDWEEAKDCFIKHFDHPDHQFMLRQQLFKLKQANNESVRQYSDKFAELVFELGEDDESEQILAQFFHGIKDDLMPLYRMATIFNPPKNLKEASLIAQSLDLINMKKSDADSKSQSGKAHNYSSKPKSNKIRCTFCHKLGHKTEECWKKLGKDNKSDTPSPSAQNNSKTSCKYCKEDGHLVNNCPKLAKKQQQLPQDKQRGSAPQQSLRAAQAENLSPVTADDESDLDVWLKDQESSKVRHISNSDSLPAKEVKIELLINGKSATAIVDTGCTDTVMDEVLAKQLDVEVKPGSANIQLGAENMSVKSSGHAVNLKVQHGSLLVEKVSMTLSRLPDRMIYLGMDLLPHLGIGLTGVCPTVQLCSDPSSADDDRMLSSTNPWPDEDKLPETDRQRFLDGVSSSIQANKQILPTSRCTHPEAVITVDTGQTAPIYRRQYPVPVSLHSKVTEQILKWQDNGVVVEAPPGNRWNMPLLVAPKKDSQGNKTFEKVRVCIDPRPLNQVIPDDDYPVPIITDIFKRHQGFKVVSVIDLETGYNQFRVKDEDQPKLAFTWNNKQFMFAGCPYGLKHVPGMFHRTIHAAIQEHSAYADNFLDDISIFSNSVEEHIQHVNSVINTLTAINLRINWEKSHLGYNRVRLLGHILSGTSRVADPQKLKACLELPRPTTGKQVESYLGATNYLRDYIPCYADIAAPLEHLRKVKDVQAVWDQACEQAYQRFQAVFSNPLTLAVPRFDLPFHLATDASQNGIAAILYQEHDGNLSYISVLAKALAPAQRNYPTTKRELLAIVWALTKLREYLYGHKVIIYTDHQALQYLLTQKQANYMVANWADILLEYNIEIVHRPGLSMVLPDAFSRIFSGSGEGKVPAPQQVKSTSGSNQTARLQIVDGDAKAVELHQFIKERLGKTEPTSEQKQDLMEKAHLSGHFGAEQMFKQLWWQGYYWPSLREECKQVAGQCPTCLQWNIKKEGFHPMTSIHAEFPWEHISLDLAGPLKTSKSGFNMILIITDICSRYVLVRPLKSKMAKEVAKELYKVISDFGVPKIMQSDNGKEFVNSVIKEMKDLLGVEHRLITPYHPEANGAAEAAVKVVKKLLSKQSKGDVFNWEKYLPTVQMMANNRIMTRTGSKPFELMFGRAWNNWATFQGVESKPATFQELLQHFQQLKEIVYPTIQEKAKQAANKESDQFRKEHSVDQPLQPGTKVMIKQVDKKQGDSEYAGPYTVLRVNQGGAYILLDATGKEFPHKISRKHLKVIELPKASDEEHDQEQDPKYEVDHIIKHRKRGNKLQYLVKWKGYSNKYNTWEPQEHFTGNQSIAAYWRSKSEQAKGRSHLGEGDVGEIQHKSAKPASQPTKRINRH